MPHSRCSLHAILIVRGRFLVRMSDARWREPSRRHEASSGRYHKNDNNRRPLRLAYHLLREEKPPGVTAKRAAGAGRTLAIGWPQGFTLGSAMKTFTATAVIIALLTVPAFSQQGKGSAPDPKAEAEKVEQKKRAQEIERDYKALIKRTTPQSTSVPSDPWHDIRPSPSKPQQ
jgi:hypothetical protein